MNNKKNNNKRSFKLLKIFLCLVLIIIIAAAALAVWQRENINAVIKAQNSTKEDIANEIMTSKANTQKEIEKYNIPIKRDFTFEEEEQIRKGTLSVDDAVKRIVGTSDEGEKSDGNEAVNASENSGSASDDESPELTQEQQIVADYLTQMYSLKAYYMAQLGALEKDIKEQYKQENGSTKNAAAIAKVVQNNMTKVMNMESESDAKIDSIITNMEAELNAIGADTEIVQIAEDAYVNEKRLWKSYYLSLYN